MHFGFMDVILLRSTQKHLTFRGPCIEIYSHNKTNEMH